MLSGYAASIRMAAIPKVSNVNHPVKNSGTTHHQSSIGIVTLPFSHISTAVSAMRSKRVNTIQAVTVRANPFTVANTNPLAMHHGDYICGGEIRN